MQQRVSRDRASSRPAPAAAEMRRDQRQVMGGQRRLRPAVRPLPLEMMVCLRGSH
jgi:hypothetical protein